MTVRGGLRRVVFALARCIAAVAHALTPVSRLVARCIDVLRHELLRRHLGACGPRLTVFWPIGIDCPKGVRVGADVSIAPYTHIWGSGGVRIGDRVMIASGCKISSLTHDPDSPAMRSVAVASAVVIEDDVWLGANAVVLPGVTIGRGAVVGAGSVVRENVPGWAIVGGVPARFIRARAAPRPDEQQRG